MKPQRALTALIPEARSVSYYHVHCTMFIAQLRARALCPIRVNSPVGMPMPSRYRWSHYGMKPHPTKAHTRKLCLRHTHTHRLHECTCVGTCTCKCADLPGPKTRMSMAWNGRRAADAATPKGDLRSLCSDTTVRDILAERSGVSVKSIAMVRKLCSG